MKVFYRPEMNATAPGPYGMSASKPGLAVADWQRHAVMGKDIEVVSFEPADPVDLTFAHNYGMVRSVLAGESPNGFGNTDPAIAASTLYTVGSMIAAAEHAVLHCEHVCSPTSGFHHAGFSFTGGYCTFNGLVVALMLLRSKGLIRTAAIVDCDVHYGNGTQDIIDALCLDWIKHYTMGRHFHSREECGRGGRAFLKWLAEAKEDCQGADIVLYQAGADPHLRDPLGGFLSGKTLMERDIMMTGIHGPLVWNLAGGYRLDSRGTIAPVLQTHRVTALAWTQHL